MSSFNVSRFLVRVRQFWTRNRLVPVLGATALFLFGLNFYQYLSSHFDDDPIVARHIIINGEAIQSLGEDADAAYFFWKYDHGDQQKRWHSKKWRHKHGDHEFEFFHGDHEHWEEALDHKRKVLELERRLLDNQRVELDKQRIELKKRVLKLHSDDDEKIIIMNGDDDDEDIIIMGEGDEAFEIIINGEKVLQKSKEI